MRFFNFFAQEKFPRQVNFEQLSTSINMDPFPCFRAGTRAAGQRGRRREPLSTADDGRHGRPARGGGSHSGACGSYLRIYTELNIGFSKLPCPPFVEPHFLPKKNIRGMYNRRGAWYSNFFINHLTKHLGFFQDSHRESSSFSANITEYSIKFCTKLSSQI